MDKMIKEIQIQKSYFNWGIAVILSMISLNIFYSSGGLIVYSWLSIFFLILSIFEIILGKNKNIKNKSNYKEVKNDK